MDGMGFIDPDDLPEEIRDGLREFVEKHLIGKGKKKDARHVVQRLPMRPEWRKAFDELYAMEGQMRAVMKKAQSLHRIAWATVEKDTGIYEDMSYDEKNQVIKVYGEKPEAAIEKITPNDIIGPQPPK